MTTRKDQEIIIGLEDKLKLAKQTLRDQFAMAALTGLMSHNGNSFSVEHFDVYDFANLSYEIADAMLEARDKQ